MLPHLTAWWAGEGAAWVAQLYQGQAECLAHELAGRQLQPASELHLAQSVQP